MIFLFPPLKQDFFPWFIGLSILFFVFQQGCTRPQPGDLPETPSTETPSSRGFPIKLQINSLEPALLAGSRESLTVTALDDQGNPLSGYPVSWSSNNPGVASIDSNGLVSAHAPGEAILSASGDGLSDSVKIYVFNPPIQHLEIRPSVIRVRTGEHQVYTVFAKDSGGRELLGLAPEWFSTRPSIATVDSRGRVTGLRTGTTRIGAKVDKKIVSFRLVVVSPG